MKKKRNSTLKVRLVCAIVFILFSYLYLSCYQADLLAMAQHVLSGGLTVYSYTWAPIVATIVLYLLQLGVYGLTHVTKRFHGLTYFPSMLVLALITDIPADMDKSQSLGVWAWLIPLLLLLYVGVMAVIKQLEPYEPEVHAHHWLSRWSWFSLFQQVVMMLLVVLVSNGNQVFHARMKMERLMVEGKYQDALHVGKELLETDSSLTMLRVACLHRTDKMGDRLFAYPLVGGSKAMIPDSVTVKALVWKSPRWMHPAWIGKRGYKIPVDYRLCGMLLDKNLDKFVVEVQNKYNVTSSSLPRHYKEALMLYTHRRANPKLIYRNPVMEADFQDYQALEHKYANPAEKQAALRDTYGNTYWYYYQYGNK